MSIVTNISGVRIVFGTTSLRPGDTKPVDDSLFSVVQTYALQGNVTYTGAPTYTGLWANRPTAASSGVGATITVQDIPSTGQTSWVSDGTFWRHAGVIPLESLAIPVILPSSGTMANNGAITLTTALPAIYAACYLALPANAISTGSAAGLYYTVMSSTTAGVVYNNTYVSGHPTIPATPVAFVTTGPGAYTQVTTSVTLLSTLIPASSMALQGVVKVTSGFAYTNSANNKTLAITFGGTNVYSKVRTTSALDTVLFDIRNAGVQNKNVSTMGSTGIPAVAASVAPVEMAVDTSVNVNLLHTAQLTSAAEYIILRGADITLAPF